MVVVGSALGTSFHKRFSGLITTVDYTVGRQVCTPAHPPRQPTRSQNGGSIRIYAVTLVVAIWAFQKREIRNKPHTMKQTSKQKGPYRIALFHLNLRHEDDEGYPSVHYRTVHEKRAPNPTL